MTLEHSSRTPRKSLNPVLILTGLVAIVVALMLFPGCSRHVGTAESTTSHIVQGTDLGTVRAAVESVGGTVTHELDIIDAVAAQLSAQQLEALTSSTSSTTAAAQIRTRAATTT